MHLKDWLATATKEQREQLAADCDTTVAYLYQIAGNHRPGSGPLIRKLDEKSRLITPDAYVSKHEMRPDIFGAVNVASGNDPISKNEAA